MASCAHEGCVTTAFPARDLCVDHLIESLHLVASTVIVGETGPEFAAQCRARRRDGARCRIKAHTDEVLLCHHHRTLWEEGTPIEQLLAGKQPKADKKPWPKDSRLTTAKHMEATLTEEPSANESPSVVADVAVTDEEHDQVEATVGDILRHARSSSREAIERRSLCCSTPGGR